MLPKLVILSNVDHETTVGQYAHQHKGEMGLSIFLFEIQDFPPSFSSLAILLKTSIRIRFWLVVPGTILADASVRLGTYWACFCMNLP